MKPGHWRDLHLLAVSLVGWPNHHLQIRPPGHPCSIQGHSCCPNNPDQLAKPPSANSSPRPSLLNSGNSCCPNNPDQPKRVEEKFRTRWNVPHTVGAINGKHISINKPKKLGSDYYNYKGFFSLVLMALVDAEYKFLWIDFGSSGSCSDAKIFNSSDLREKIEDGGLGLPAPESPGEGGPDLHYFLLGGDAFALMSWMVKPYSRRQFRREERIANYKGQRLKGQIQRSITSPKCQTFLKLQVFF